MGLLDTLFNFCFHCSHFYFWAVVRLFHIRLKVNVSENDTFAEELKLVQNSLDTTAWWKISSCFITWLQNEFPQDVKSPISRIECTRKWSHVHFLKPAPYSAYSSMIIFLKGEKCYLEGSPNIFSFIANFHCTFRKEE